MDVEQLTIQVEGRKACQVETMEQLERAAEPLYCRSVGWLVEERKECKVIVPHISGEKNGTTILQGCGDLTIPTKAILKISVLRKE